MTLPKNDKDYVYDLVVKGIPLKEIASIHNVTYQEAWSAFVDGIGFASYIDIPDGLVTDQGYDLELYETILMHLN